MSRIRVILVDDQKLILLALERMLRRMRTTLDVVLADSGRQAREFMETQPFDVLVTDLNMPGYGGAELLEWTRETQPGTARIVLSGHQDKAMIQAATRSAHRFLTKPCEPDVLLEAILQMSRLHDLPQGEVDVRPAVAGLVQLPGNPVTCHRIHAFLNAPEAPVTALRDPVLQDPGFAAKALQLVNSAFYGIPRPLVNPWEALQLLDREKLAGIETRPAAPEVEARLKPIREAHLALARKALAITRAEDAPKAVQDLAYAAGLLAAAGPMILAMAFPGRSRDGVDEVRIFGGDGPEISRQYLNLLALPAPLLDIVAHYRCPSRAQTGPSLALAAVHVASGSRDDPFLTRAGFLARIDAWQQPQAEDEP